MSSFSGCYNNNSETQDFQTQPDLKYYPHCCEMNNLFFFFKV